MHGRTPRLGLMLLAALTMLALTVPTVATAKPSAAEKAHAAAKAKKKRRTARDLDGDGIANTRDRDIDGDGILNMRDRDIDGDGVPNAKDRDIDGDGIKNAKDRDIDGDGIKNAKDRDVDGDGVKNVTDPDVDGDGVKNGKDPDVDGDGVKNARDTDMDGDGVPNRRDADMDGDGIKNAEDDDENGDGKPYGVGVGPAPVVGISDQRPTTFADPLFTALGMRHARLITPWNSILTQPARLTAWLEGARAAGIQPLVSFEHGEEDACPAAPCHAPTVDEYRTAFQAFRAAFPWVTTISPWNEANHQSQPTGTSPQLAAQYYNVVYDHCAGCTIVAADLLDSPNLEGYVRAFRALAKGNPQLWGLHNYSDANRFRTTGTDTMLASVPGQVWLTETGGVVEFTTTAGVAALPYDEARATAGMSFLFDKLVTPNSKRITRVYVYQWKKTNATDRFDAGIVSFAGAPRASYAIVRDHVVR